MHRFALRIVMALGFLCAPMAPAFASDFCPVLTLPAFKFCDCIVWNYSTQADAGVTITLNTANGTTTCGPSAIPAGGHMICEDTSNSSGFCACKVTGNGSLTRTSLVVNNLDLTPLSAVPCN